MSRGGVYARRKCLNGRGTLQNRRPPAKAGTCFITAGFLDTGPGFRQDARSKGKEMRQEDHFASVAGGSAGQERFGTPPLTPLLAPMRSPSEKQFPIS